FGRSRREAVARRVRSSSRRSRQAVALRARVASDFPGLTRTIVWKAPCRSLTPMADRVALFVTCLGDTLFPQVGQATVAVLERLGVTVDFPREQTCCGQMHVNAGYA